MAVAKRQGDRVIANRPYVGNGYVFFTDLQGFLAGAMADGFGGLRVNPEILGRHFENAAIVEMHFQYRRYLVQLDFSRQVTAWSDFKAHGLQDVAA